MDWDDAYANAPYILGADTYPERWSTEARAFRDRMLAEGRASLKQSYGPSKRQRYDLFTPQGAAEGLCVFVHGGYWMKFHRTFWSHFAAGPLARGWAVAIPSYDLCPQVRIADITTQIARAIITIAVRVEGPIVLAGHSAGGHLVARMCVEGVLPKTVFDRIRHVMPISPVSDLRPLINTAMNVDFQLDDASAAAESPVLMAPVDVPVTVWVGADERPVFLDQARWLAEAWDAAHVIDEGRHHFDVIDALQDVDSPMIQHLWP
ncbi:alpha/beta hydrolase [Roseovarius aestuarii]|uniref:Alpha/beta hydrolase family protein n=1 Tax=Roseovarius aestuarii TaxID=475083 RepID=A0A1X7BPD8_9RHOB|nr:alpha/beta hydrolase [Roseovarius aestuarii]SMC11465.1 Alpha/beta hydrolase family protein [Roseovarius aestuarii]